MKSPPVDIRHLHVLSLSHCSRHDRRHAIVITCWCVLLVFLLWLLVLLLYNNNTINNTTTYNNNTTDPC